MSPFARPGMSVIELLVVIGIIAVVTSIIIPAVSHARSNARAARCLTNLHAISTAIHLYSDFNEYRFPAPGDPGTQWEDLLGTYITNPNTFDCPDDHELFDALGSSYDWRDTGERDTTLAGKHSTDNNRADAVLAFDSLPGWHHRGQMNAVLLDGSTESMPEETCMGDLLKPILR